MSVSDRWLLPDGVDELLPPEAWALELLRRRLLDHYAASGYQLVAPPLIEYLESLLTGTGNNLDLQTFKVTDQLTGRMMGVRADITPQVARIDTHLLKSKAVSRLCYVDTVLHTRPAHMLTNRSPMQIGCECFGEAGQSADIEIISLMLDTLALTGIDKIHVDLAHVGIYRGLVESANLSKSDEAALFDALSRKSIPELDALKQSVSHGSEVISIIREVAELSGGTDALEKIRQSVADIDANAKATVLAAIDELQSIARRVQALYPAVEIGVDFCELRGYNYHTGVMFSAFMPGYGYALAKGGRYDDIGKDFGESRAATGFSGDLKTLVRVAGALLQMPEREVIWAPMSDDVGLREKIDELRQHNTVVQQLSEDDRAADHGCSKVLHFDGRQWQVQDL